jgi:hypothetical protein
VVGPFLQIVSWGHSPCLGSCFSGVYGMSRNEHEAAFFWSCCYGMSLDSHYPYLRVVIVILN